MLLFLHFVFFNQSFECNFLSYFMDVYMQNLILNMPQHVSISVNSLALC